MKYVVDVEVVGNPDTVWMKKQGARYRDLDYITKLDAIAADKQLRAAFEGIVREWQARTAVVEGQQEIAVQDAFALPAAGNAE